MTYVFLLFEILAGIFAVIGVYASARVLLDAHVRRRAGAVCEIYIKSCEGDAEYAVRFAESRFIYGEYAGFFDSVSLSEDIRLSPYDYERLCAEFPGTLGRRGAGGSFAGVSAEHDQT